jgi:hypothetical protein
MPSDHAGKHLSTGKIHSGGGPIDEFLMGFVLEMPAPI